MSDVEAAARALFAAEMPGSDWNVFPSLHDKFRSKAATIERLAETILTAATPLIRAQAFEEAAQVADDHHKAPYAGPEGDAYWIAAKIRALKEYP